MKTMKFAKESLVDKLERERNEQMQRAKKPRKAAAQDLTPVVLTADTLMNLVERVVKLESDNNTLRKALDELRNEVYEHIPAFTEPNKLSFKTYTEQGEEVRGEVAAEITH